MICRAVGILLLLAAPIAPHPAAAQIPGWGKSPAIVVLGAQNDPRVPLIHEAVAFWNAILADQPTSFRLGAVTIQVGSIPAAELKKLSEIPAGGLAGKFPMPDGVRTSAGDMVIALSDIDFVSFGARWPEENKAMVAIKSHRAYPFDIPNAMRNVIAHEIGHALGLIHNSDPTTLMCGRPAACRPDMYRSNEPRYFPLHAQDHANLRRMYPINWPAR